MNATTTIKYCVICKINVTECQDISHKGYISGGAYIDVQMSLDEYQNNIKNNVWPKLKRQLLENALSKEVKDKISSDSKLYAHNKVIEQLGEHKFLTIENCPIPLKNSNFTFFLLLLELSTLFFLISFKIFTLKSLLIVFAPILIILLITFSYQYNYNETLLCEIGKKSNGKRFSVNSEEWKILRNVKEDNEIHNNNCNRLHKEIFDKRRQELVEEKIKSIQL
jgi:hypothetical protein